MGTKLCGSVGTRKFMTIQYKFFTVPIKATEQMESALNRFLLSKRVLTVHREFVQNGENSFWALGVEYLSDGNSGAEKASDKNRVDYREVLDPDDFALFVKLREWRKGVALDEGLPVYTVFNNEQLAEIARRKVRTLTGLKKIDGVGDAKVKKYGQAILDLVLPADEDAGEDKGGLAHTAVESEKEGSDIPYGTTTFK